MYTNGIGKGKGNCNSTGKGKGVHLYTDIPEMDFTVHPRKDMIEDGVMETTDQGSTPRTVHLPGTTKSGCRASRFPDKLARQTIKYFADNER
jgi:hypothetical protein